MRLFDGSRSGAHGRDGVARGHGKSGRSSGRSDYSRGGTYHHDRAHRYGDSHRDHRYHGPGYRGLYWNRYRDYRRCYSYAYATYRPVYYPYRYYYDDYYYGGYPYFGGFTLFDYTYRRSPSPVYVENVIYTEEPTPTVQYVTPAPSTTTTIVPQPQAEAPVAGASAGEAEAVDQNTYWIELGNTAFGTGGYEEARHLFMRAVLADDDDGYAKVFYGLANFAMGDYGAAATAFRRGLTDAPELIDNPIDFRSLYSDEAALLGQVAKLAELVETHPGDREARLLLGYLYYATAKPEKAVATLAALSDPGSADTLAFLIRDAAVRVTMAKEKEPS